MKLASIQAILSPTLVACLALMAAGALGAWTLTPTLNRAAETRIDLDALVPTKFADWAEVAGGRLVLPDPKADQLVTRIYSGILARTYANQSGQRVMLVIAYGGDQSDDLQLHRPEICYAANGYRTGPVTRSEKMFSGERVLLSRLQTRNTQIHETVSYWMRVGDRQVSTSLDRQWAKLQSGFAGVVPDGVLVRVSSRQRTDAPDVAFALQEAFLSDFVGALSPAAKTLLLGNDTGSVVG